MSQRREDNEEESPPARHERHVRKLLSFLLNEEAKTPYVCSDIHKRAERYPMANRASVRIDKSRRECEGIF